jgi:phosphonate degradation associated HDIG domain protein
MPHVKEVLELFARSGGSQYGGEAVTQLEHALQCAMLAEQEGASASLITAALLHDVGHLLHDLPDDAPDQGIDDGHENSAFNYLRRLFPAAVTQPVRLHVAAKRYLSAVEPGYMELLSGPSIVSLRLQGGPMSSDEVEDFRRNPHCEAAIRLRRWDDTAKDPQMKTPTLAHFAQYVRQAALEHGHS